MIVKNIYGEIMQDVDIMVNCRCGGILNATIYDDKVKMVCENCEFDSWFGVELLDDKKFLEYLRIILRAIEDFETKNPNCNYDFTNAKRTLNAYISVIEAYIQAISD
jgi:hypothetical protein